MYTDIHSSSPQFPLNISTSPETTSELRTHYVTILLRLDPNYTEQVDQAVAYVQPGLALSDGQSGLGDTLVGTGSTVENSTVTYVQDTNAYEEPMINYAYSQQASSSSALTPFQPPPLPSVTAAPAQWHSGPPNVFEHNSQLAPGPFTTTNSYTHSNHSQAYAAATGATGSPQEQQHHGSAWVTMPGGLQFAIPVALAIALMTSSQHHCGNCGSRPV